MNISLNDALALLNLQPGSPYRTTINGQELEVRVVEKSRVDESSDAASQFNDQVLIKPWFSIPNPVPAVAVKANLGPLPLPDPPIIPDEAEEIG